MKSITLYCDNLITGQRFNLKNLLAFMFHRLVPLACSESELSSETVNPFIHVGRTPWTGDQPIARPIPKQDSITQRNTDLHPCLERDLNPRSQCLSGPRPYAPYRPRGRWDRFNLKI
jgi:hypothetical protein